MMHALDRDVLASAIDAAGRAFVITDTSPRILAVNRVFTETTGYAASEVVGKNPSVLRSGQQGKTFYRDMWRGLMARGTWEGEIWNRRKSGEVYPEWLTINAIRDTGGAVRNYVAVFSDITQRKFTEAQLEERAYFDPLTGLLNRQMLEDRLEQALGIAKRGAKTGCLMLIDLDGFKPVNDHYGHEAGDRVLLTMAARIVGSMRVNDTVCRLGGDEFTVLCPEIDGRSGCEVILRRLTNLAREPIRLACGEYVRVGISVGIALFPDDAGHPKSLMHAADKAMYAAKAAGKGGYRFAADVERAKATAAA
jgi:diguanylate cyclase (GGDEF)-like protein/PAS domain S-box-containing protein